MGAKPTTMTNLKGSKTDEEWAELTTSDSPDKKMKYWEEDYTGTITMIKGYAGIMEVSEHKGKIEFQGTDGGAILDLTKSQALELIEELKQWIINT